MIDTLRHIGFALSVGTLATLAVNVGPAQSATHTCVLNNTFTTTCDYSATGSVKTIFTNRNVMTVDHDNAIMCSSLLNGQNQTCSTVNIILSNTSATYVIPSTSATITILY